MEYKLERVFRNLEKIVPFDELRKVDSVILSYLREIGLRRACDYVRENDEILVGCENFDLGLKGAYVRGKEKEAIFLERGELEIVIERGELGTDILIRNRRAENADTNSKLYERFKGISGNGIIRMRYVNDERIEEVKELIQELIK